MELSLWKYEPDNQESKSLPILQHIVNIDWLAVTPYV